MKLIDNWHTRWSVWLAAFWGAIGGLLVVLSALLYVNFSWAVGALVIVISATIAIARVLKQPGIES